MIYNECLFCDFYEPGYNCILFKDECNEFCPLERYDDTQVMVDNYDWEKRESRITEKYLATIKRDEQ